MFAHHYNPFGVTDPFYLVNQLFYTDEQHRKRKLVHQRRHLHVRRSEQSRQMQVLHQMDEDEEEMRRRRLDILKRYMDEKPEPVYNNTTSSRGLDVERRDESKDCCTDFDWIPREVSIVQSQDTLDSEELNARTLSKHDPDSRRSLLRRESSLESALFLDARNDGFQGGEAVNCCVQQCVPHLIGVHDLDEDTDDDDSVL